MEYFNILTYGAEPFLRSWQLCSCSGIFQHFKEPEGSSPCSQESSTGPYPEPDRSSSYIPFYLSKIYCLPTYILVFLVVSFLLAFPPIYYMHSLPPPFMPIIKRIDPCLRLRLSFCNKIIFYGEELLAPHPTQVGQPPLVGCPWLLIQYICSYYSYLEMVSSIRSLKARHAVVTWDPPNMDLNILAKCNSYEPCNDFADVNKDGLFSINRTSDNNLSKELRIVWL
jgi:hypothetical protein